MDPFTPGLRELARIVSRQALRLRLIFHERRKLSRAETELGVLGWQQADFDEATQMRINEITDYEREQSRLTNDSAALGLAVRQLKQSQDIARTTFEAEVAHLESERAKLAAATVESERQLGERRGFLANFAAGAADLERQLDDARKQYGECLALARQTPEIHAELVRARERSVALPHEIADLRTQQIQIASHIQRLEAALAEGRKTLGELEKKLRGARVEFAAVDGNLSKDVASREREKRGVEKQIAGLEKAKVNPLRQIGRVLADNDIAPMNQPHALTAVQVERVIIERIETELAVSLETSAREDYKVLIKSAAAWIGLLLLAAAITVALSWK